MFMFIDMFLFLRLEFEQTYLPYYTEIDAVALLGKLTGQEGGCSYDVWYD